MKTKVLPAFIIIILAALTGCGSPIMVRQVASREPLTVGSRGTRTIMLKKIVLTLPRGKIIGQVQSGVFCSYKEPLCWRDDKTAVSDSELMDVLRNRLEASGYTLAGDPDELFEDRSAERAEFLMAAKIKEVNANVCYPRSWSDDWVTAKGGVYLEVEWELYSKRLRDVVMKLTTQGSSMSMGKPESYQDIFCRAFDVAAQNLLAGDAFYRQVAYDAGRPIRKAQEEMSSIKVKYRTVEDVGKMNDVDREGEIGVMRGAVVTVFSGSGHGSGFLISEDGYVLTNEHVVGGAGFVTVKFVTGKEVNGQVLRVNKTRDVALIRLEKDVYPCLPLGNTAEINVGDEVFSIGTPLSEDLCETVTKGIVSSFRVKDEVKYVQSDVNIHPGNSGGPLVSLNRGVVGICVSGIAVGPYTMGLNYFIPIEEALKALKITKDNA